MDSVDAVSRITVVGTTRRLDVTLPVAVPVAELLLDLVEMLGERDGELPARWALVRVGGQALDPEQALSEQHVTSGTMLFLRDITREDPPPAIEDYAAMVAVTIDAQGARWTEATAPPALVWGAAACWVAAGLVLLLAGDSQSRAAFGFAAAVIAVVAGLVMAQRFGRRSTAALIGLSAVPLWAAAGAGLAGLADSGATAGLAAALGSAGVGAAIAILVAGDVVLVPAVGVITVTLVPALVLGVWALAGAGIVHAAALLCPIALGGFSLPARLAVRLARIDDPTPGAIGVRARRGRRLMASMLIGISVVLAGSSAVLAVSGDWFAWALVGAAAIATVAKARHFRFTAEVAPLLAAGLTGLLLLEYPFVAALGIGSKNAGGAAAVLTADALILALAGTSVRRWDISAQLRRRLGRVEAIATAATVPLALAVLGAYTAVARLVHGFS